MNEHDRFVNTCTRRIPGLPSMDWIEGKSILVTGGTGCIGSRLMRELAKYSPKRLVSISLIPELSPWPYAEGAEYREADIRDYSAFIEAFKGDWDVVFHTAAQRDPGLAEQLVRETITTNVFGSLNVLLVSELLEVPRVVFASTGKALRPYSPDVYTASKRIVECLLANSSVPNRAAVRFTHVVDNSIFYNRLRDWCHYGQPIRLHGRDIVFYVQSAREAAELLIGAAASPEGSPPQIHSITDLGMPVSLYDLAVDARNDMCSDSEIVISGYDQGYEAVPFPGLYDPMTAGEVSPLINALEAAESWQPYPGVDAFPLRMGSLDLSRLARSCNPPCGVSCPIDIRTEMNSVSWDIMETTTSTAQIAALERIVSLCKQYEPLRSPHNKMLEIITEAAKGSSTTSKIDLTGGPSF